MLAQSAFVMRRSQVRFLFQAIFSENCMKESHQCGFRTGIELSSMFCVSKTERDRQGALKNASFLGENPEGRAKPSARGSHARRKLAHEDRGMGKGRRPVSILITRYPKNEARSAREPAG